VDFFAAALDTQNVFLFLTLCILLSLTGAAGSSKGAFGMGVHVMSRWNTYFISSPSLLRLYNSARSPLLHFALLPAPYTSIGPIPAGYTTNVSKRQPDRDFGAVFGSFGRPAYLNAHVCFHPAWAASVDDQTWMVFGQDAGECVHARLGESVASTWAHEAGCCFVVAGDGVLFDVLVELRTKSSLNLKR
jgi:hypothetical protein